MDDTLLNETEVETGPAGQIAAEEPENIFLSSLMELKEEDIELSEAARTAKKPPIDFVRYFIMLVCVCVCIYAGYYFIDRLFQFAEAANDTDLFRTMFHDAGDDDISELGSLRRARESRPLQDMLSMQRQTVREVFAVTHEGVGEAEQRRVLLEQRRGNLQAMSRSIPSLFGWIRVSHTNIDYPMVQGEDNDFYLFRTPFGERNSAGSIFVDYRNDRNMDNNFNTIIYGHNMANQSMFGSGLTRLNWNREMFDDMRIEITTMDGIYIYQVFSAHPVHPYFFFRETEFTCVTGRPSIDPDISFTCTETGVPCNDDFHCDERWVYWLHLMRSLSTLRSSVELTADSRIVTLSTCTNFIHNPRFAVHGVLIDVIR